MTRWPQNRGRRLSASFRFIAATTALLYTLIYVVWRLLLLSPLYERWWPLQLSEVFGSWVYAPLGLLLALALVARSRWALYALIAPTLFFGVEYGRQFLPNQHIMPVYANSGLPVRVLTWNMHYTADPYDEFHSFVAELKPDVIALQELSLRMTRRFGETLRETYPHQALHTGSHTGGLALLSRYPVRVAPSPARPFICQCLVVEADIEGRTATFIVVHIWRPSIQFELQESFLGVQQFSYRYQTPVFDQLLQQMETVDGPLVVLGDFNTTERQPNYRRLRTQLEDAFGQAGWGMGYTFPSNARLRGWRVPPLIRIDHILISRDWQAKAAWTGGLPPSDHNYVAADLVLRP